MTYPCFLYISGCDDGHAMGLVIISGQLYGLAHCIQSAIDYWIFNMLRLLCLKWLSVFAQGILFHSQIYQYILPC